MNFHDIRLPLFIEALANSVPEFSTSCVSTISGREVRSKNREYSRQKYIIKNLILSHIEFELFNNFFRARRGRQYSFRLRDNVDYKVVQQFITKGDGKSNKFQLFKTYDDPISPYQRKITKPISGSCTLYIENRAVQSEVNYDAGIVELDTILPENHILKADFSFDSEVRFASDDFEYFQREDGALQLSDILLLEVP